MEHRFEYLTSEELRERIAQKPLLILGIGTIEEHGAHLPTGTDMFITQRFTDDVAAYLKAHSAVPFLTLPTIWTGYSAVEMQRWPGTIRMRTRTVMDMMRGSSGSLCEMGFYKILILNGHGHHTELLRVVAREVADDHGVYPAVANFLYLGAKEYNAVRSGEAGSSIHGGEDETSVNSRPPITSTGPTTNSTTACSLIGTILTRLNGMSVTRVIDRCTTAST